MSNLYLKRAIELSEEGRKIGGPFGAVIVKDGEIIAEAYNEVTTRHDPTAHAEVLAIRLACAKLHSFSLRSYRCTLYSSCEPCPMCFGAIHWAGLIEVVYAATRKDAADAGFIDKAIYDALGEDGRRRQTDVLFWEDSSQKEKARSTLLAWKNMPNKLVY